MQKERLYFMGIGGTGMASVAGLFQEAGYAVSGSDKGVYPPMSDLLAELKIPYATPYDSKNVLAKNIDLVVVANALSRGNPELESMLENKLAYTSFPALMGERILKDRVSLVVAGTHGKTTTTSLLAHCLDALGEEPGFLIGGVPRNFSRGFHLGKGPCFAIEGDEYDTAFFDKGPKFLHYCPKYAILNNLEFDHADIYKDLQAIEAQFTKLCQLVEDPSCLIANVDDPGIEKLLRENGYWDKVTRVAGKGDHLDAQVRMVGTEVDEVTKIWSATAMSPVFGPFKVQTKLAGAHNIANIGQVIALIGRLCTDAKLRKMPKLKALQQAILSFEGVKRRLDLLVSAQGIEVYEDFAHHPTAIATVIDGFRKMHPKRRLLVAFEPANATGRRNILQDDFADALRLADRVYIGKCPVDTRIPEAERMDTTALAQSIGNSKATAFSENVDILKSLEPELRHGDTVIFMSPGSFSGIQHQLGQKLSREKKLA